MEKRLINPWQWQEKNAYAQAVEIKQPTATLYCAGQAAIDAEGQPSTGDMAAQLQQVLANVEQVIVAAGYACGDIVRLTMYTTSTAELFTCFEHYLAWVRHHRIEAAATLVEVRALAYESLKVEVEVTAVR